MRVVGAPERAIDISRLAGAGERLIGKGSARATENPPCDPEGCLGRLGLESFLEPQVFTHAARVKVDRETGVVRVLQVAAVHDSGTILNPIGATGQVYGGVIMGIGQALLEASQLDEEGRQRNPHLLDYKLVTAADAPRVDVAWIETPAENGGPNGTKGVGEPPTVPTPGAIANAIAKVARARVRRAADDARAGLGRDRRRITVTSSFVSAGTVEEALAALAAGARPVAGGTDLVVGARQGKAPLPESIVAIHRLGGAAGHERRRAARLRLGALVTHAEIALEPVVLERLTALADASAIVGSHATRAHGTLGGNLMNASPAMETGGPLQVFGATVTLRSGAGRAAGAGRRAAGPAPGETSAAAGRAPHRGRGAAAGRRDRERLRPARVPPPDGDRRRRRDRGGRARRRHRRLGRRRDHGARPDDPARA